MNDLLDNISKMLNAQKHSQAIKLLEELDSQKLNEAERQLAEYYWGICLFETDDIEQAIVHFQACLASKAKIDQGINASAINYELSLCFYKKFLGNHLSNDLDQSISYCNQAISSAISAPIITQRSGFAIYDEESPLAYINMLIHLGVLHQAQCNLDKAISILLTAKAVCQHYSHLKLLGQIYDELGSTYLLKKDPILSRYYYLKSLRVKSLINNQNGMGITLRNLVSAELLCPLSSGTQELERLNKRIQEERA